LEYSDGVWIELHRRRLRKHHGRTMRLLTPSLYSKVKKHYCHEV
jgi:hypothetical protein